MHHLNAPCSACIEHLKIIFQKAYFYNNLNNPNTEYTGNYKICKIRDDITALTSIYLSVFIGITIYKKVVENSDQMIRHLTPHTDRTIVYQLPCQKVRVHLPMVLICNMFLTQQ